MGSKLFINMKFDLHMLFDGYLSTYGSSFACESNFGSQLSQTSQTIFKTQLPTFRNIMSLIKARFKKHKMESKMGGSIRS